ncbi:MAG: ribosome maturation factor RimP, partial [Rhizobacter sp.]|nr:ribosome maturation factor RimP [Rhizobacter sp.]
LKMPFQGRKKYSGELQALGDGWRLVMAGDKLSHTRATRRAAGGAGKAEVTGAADAAGDLALDFSLDEVREARLVPVVDFKGRRFAPAEPANEAPAATDATALAKNPGGLDQ